MKKEAIDKLPLPSLRNLQAFIEVANAGSINIAAMQLNVTASAVSHQIASLEAFLGKKLFIRNGKGIILTQLGEEYLFQISGAMNTIGRISDKIINEPYNDILRVHSSPSFGMLWLIRKLGSFRSKHPDILINLNCSYETLQFSRDNIDIDIRHGIPDWDGYKILTIKNEKLNVMASPEYLLRCPVENINDVESHDLIYSSVTLVNWERWFSFFKINLTKKPAYNMIFDRSYMSFEAAKMGLGMIFESSLLGAEFVAKGTLHPVFGKEYEYPINAHHVVFPHGNELNYKVRTFIEWMRAELLSDGFEL
ncbi:LysR substrate-binding domain-containing protein [Samsonia erythrinae]|uniref:DNA-binding transcriptional LysR family regulator n=1 Tax=Samsonia erythrinae TaxID=160434 RepID=A0A4R3VRJ8_9GAMM|nr:LysR substrate-binding domain-containing protein [Samsonia erythrinae]TCV08579.1 DNA-binding transcriptional LysR family regulator [Samsonia erythrinae]